MHLPFPTPNPQAHRGQSSSGRRYHTPARRRCSCPLLGVGVGLVDERPGTLAKAGAEEGAPLAAPSKQRSLFSMVPARPSYRTPFPVPFKGP